MDELIEPHRAYVTVIIVGNNAAISQINYEISMYRKFVKYCCSTILLIMGIQCMSHIAVDILQIYQFPTENIRFITN